MRTRLFEHFKLSLPSVDFRLCASGEYCTLDTQDISSLFDDVDDLVDAVVAHGVI